MDAERHPVEGHHPSRHSETPQSLERIRARVEARRGRLLHNSLVDREVTVDQHRPVELYEVVPDGVDLRSASGQDAEPFERPALAFFVLSDQRLDDLQEMLMRARVQCPDKAEVEEGDLLLAEQQVIAWVGIRGEEPETVEAPIEEAKHDFAEPVAIGLVPFEGGQKGVSLDELLGDNSRPAV